MKSRIRHLDYENVVIEHCYPYQYGCLEEVSERQQRGLLFFGECEYSELFFKGFHIGHSKLMIKQPMRLEVKHDYKIVKIGFTLSGKMLANELQSNLQAERMPNEYNIYFINGFQGFTCWETSKELQIFEIDIIPELFLKYLPTYEKQFDVFREKIERGETCALSAHNYPTTLAMQFIMRDIFTSERKGFFKRIYLENKIVELLLLQLEQISELATPVSIDLNNNLAGKMMVVKEYIETHNLRSCTLSDLAKVAGTNVYILKKGFKQMFGTTVFGYWNELKMAEAKALLMDGALTVTEVANHLGYKNPQHFTRAYKRTYGHVPSKWIRQTVSSNLD